MSVGYYTIPEEPGIVLIHDRHGWWEADLQAGTCHKIEPFAGTFTLATEEEREQARAIRRGLDMPIPVRLGALRQEVEAAQQQLGHDSLSTTLRLLVRLGLEALRSAPEQRVHSGDA